MFLVKTRKTNTSDWKLINGSLLFRHFGLPIEEGKNYRICAFDLVVLL